jgi:hypothetical protein
MLLVGSLLVVVVVLVVVDFLLHGLNMIVYFFWSL